MADVRSVIDDPRGTTPDDLFESVSLSHLPWDLDLAGDLTPSVTSTDLGDSWVVGCRIGRMLGRRRKPELRRTPGEYVAVLMVHRGTEVLVQHGRTAEVSAGTAALWDGVRPVECFTAKGLVKHTMFVPRSVLAEALPDLDTALIRTIPDSVRLRLLSSWLQTTMSQPDLGDATAMAERMAVDLLRSALAHDTGRAADPHEVLLLQVKTFLDAHLGDPSLTLGAVARANAISLRYLHLLFHSSGDTARGYLRRRRLERAQHLLLGTDITVSEVAARSGFDSPSAFSRAYRARYGIAPRDARRLGDPQPS